MVVLLLLVVAVVIVVVVILVVVLLFMCILSPGLGRCSNAHPSNAFCVYS